MSKKFTASYEPYKRLLPVVLLPFARDATSTYKLNTLYVLHVFTITDTIDMSPTIAVTALITTTVRRQWLLSSPYITLLVNYAVAEGANWAMGLFGLFLCLLSLHGGYDDWSAQVTCVRWAEVNQVAEWSDSTLLDESQLDRRVEITE